MWNMRWHFFILLPLLRATVAYYEGSKCTVESLKKYFSPPWLFERSSEQQEDNPTAIAVLQAKGKFKNATFALKTRFFVQLSLKMYL